MPNRDPLTFETALLMTQALLTIGERPYWPPGAINAVAEDLVRWCQGAIIDRLAWSPEAQAQWLITEAREQWDEWKGTRALHALFLAKFRPGNKPLEHRVFRGRVDPTCSVCGDTGFQIVEVSGVSAARQCVCKQSPPLDPGPQKENEMDFKSPAISDLATRKSMK